MLPRLGGLTPGQRLLNAFFHATAARTAGFTTWDFGQARQQTLFMLSGLMFIGGAPGSMAGGIKITTVAALLAAIWGSLRGQSEPTLFARRLPIRLIGQALAVTTLALVLIVNVALADQPARGRASWRIIRGDPLRGDLGVRHGRLIDRASTAPQGRSQLLLILMMFVGRLGPITVALVLTERRHEERYRYPSESLRIG